MAVSAEEKARQLVEKIKKEVDRAAGLGLNAAIRFLASRVKETLSVPAPRRRVVAPNGDIYYVAKTRATPGAPPRKLSGRLRGSITSEMRSPLEGVVGSNARADLSYSQKIMSALGFHSKGFNYPKFHEEHNHKFLRPTYDRYKNEIARIVGQEVVEAFE